MIAKKSMKVLSMLLAVLICVSILPISALAAPNTYRVTFDYNGGAGTVTSKEVTDGTPYGELPEAVREGYVFVNWTTDGTLRGRVEAGAPVSKTDDHALKALWAVDVSKTYNVSYDGNGATSGTAPVDTMNYTMDSISTVSGQGDLARTGYTFLGWSTNNGAASAEIIEGDSIAMTANTTLYAVWEINTYQLTVITNPSHATVTVRDNDGNKIVAQPDGSYLLEAGEYAYTATAEYYYKEKTVTFSVVDRDLLITVTLDMIFTDVYDLWYRNAVEYSMANNLFTGTSDTTWEPDTALTRAMFVTVLGKYSGIEGDDSGTCIFDDVDDGKWYTTFVQWASDEGLVEGIGNNKFDPNAPITRQEMAMIFWKYVNKTGADMTADATMYNSFPDNGETASWAVTALTWATDRGVINGDELGRLLPTGTATRAQAAQVFMVIIENVL